MSEKRRGRVEVVRTDAGWHVRGIAGNGEPLWSSEVYTRHEAAQEFVDNNAPGSWEVVEVDER